MQDELSRQAQTVFPALVKRLTAPGHLASMAPRKNPLKTRPERDTISPVENPGRRQVSRRPALRHLALVLALIIILSSCAGWRAASYHFVGEPEVYTLVNLHPDEKRRRLYSVNYQQAGLIPLCTKVRIESVTRADMSFVVLAGQRKYHYIFHNSLQDPIDKHLDKYFGKTCPANKAESLNDVDRDGIRQGHVLKGMTKEGVILAVGYPPEHVTPTLESNAWRYWRNRFNTRLIHFVDGKVLRIQE